VIRSPPGAALDGFQTHSVYEGYGTGNTFRGNRIEGAWPGFGIGLYPKLGLLGDAGKPASCS